MSIEPVKIVVTTFILGMIVSAESSTATDRTTQSILKFVDTSSAVNHRRHRQVTTVSQNTGLKASDYLNSGEQKFNKQDYKGALADLNRAIQLDSNFVEAYNYRGNLRQNKLQDYQGALADFNRAIQLNPSYALLYKNRGFLKVKWLNDNRGALADLNRAIQLDPTFAAAYGHRGGVKHEMLNDRIGGIADTKQAARLFKEQGDITNYNIATGLLKKWQQVGQKSRR